MNRASIIGVASRYPNVPQECLLHEAHIQGQAQFSQSAEPEIDPTLLHDDQRDQIRNVSLAAYESLNSVSEVPIQYGGLEYLEKLKEKMDKEFGEGHNCFACLLWKDKRCLAVIYNKDRQPIRIIPKPIEGVPIEEYPQFTDLVD